MESLTIRQIIDQVESGQIRIPAFQRGFVWDPERVAHLMDSLYKEYPYGALLFWRANEQLKVEKKLGPFTLPNPRDEYPIDYVLDGQQRITSIYATFQTTYGVSDFDEWKEIFFDFSVSDDAQEPQFFALHPDETDQSRHFPLRALFDTVAYRKATNNFGDEIAKRIDNMQAKFKEARVPVQLFRTDEKGAVAVIFERINRQGVPLDTLQLLSAWTWSEDFQLQGQFEDLVDELEAKGFDAINFDENLLLRCASAILVTNPRPEAIVSISGEDVRERFDEVVNGILGALDFLQMNLGLRRIENLPFQTLLVPLAVFFAVSGSTEIVLKEGQKERLLRWFWKASFSRRYSSGVLRNLEDDIKAVLQLKGGQQSTLGNFSAEINMGFFLKNNFSIRNVNTKTFILLFTKLKPLNFVSGTPIDVNIKLKEYNLTEFHHLMPKAYLNAQVLLSKISINCLANFCFLSRSENKHLGGEKPSIYRKKMPKSVDDIIKSTACPISLFNDNFDEFIKERAELLVKEANKLLI